MPQNSRCNRALLKPCGMRDRSRWASQNLPFAHTLPGIGVPLPHQVSLTGGLYGLGGDGSDEFRAKVIGVDADKDIAVLKIDVPPNKVGIWLRLLTRAAAPHTSVGSDSACQAKDRSQTAGVPSQSLRPLRHGDSADLMVGQKVYAIGEPWDS